MLIYVVSGVVVLLLTRLLWRRWKYDLHKVPSLPGLPLLGNTLDFVLRKDQRHAVLRFGSMFKRLGYPKLIRTDFMGLSMLLLTDQDCIRNVVMSKTAPFPRFIDNSAIFRMLMPTDQKTKALIQLPGLTPYVKAIRRVYANAMQSTNLKKATPQILKYIDMAIDIIEEKRKNGPIELSKLLSRLTLDVIGALAFEINLGGLDGSRDIHRLFEEMKKTAVKAMRNPLQALYWKCVPWSKEFRAFTKHSQELRHAYTSLIDTFQSRADPVDGEEPMWYALRTMIDPETDAPLGFQTKLAEVGVIVLAGMETTARQLGWILMLLASSTDVTQKLLEELNKHGLYGRHSHEVQFDDLGDLSYLAAIIKEGMRLSYTAIGAMPRVVPEDMAILGYRIPKGTLIVIPGTCAYSTEEEWGDPDVFRPERWLTGEDWSNNFNLGFSVGPRDCVGQKLAMLEMRLTIVKLVTRYELTLEGDWKHIFENARDMLVIEPRNGIWFQLHPRIVKA